MRDYATRWPNARVLSVEEFVNDKHNYDFILCGNVLSAIPTKRARSDVLRRLAKRLSVGGRCLFTTQYRNTDFRLTAQSPSATPHLDGSLLITERGTFYYGLIDKEKLLKLVRRHGFHVEIAWTRRESAYVLTTRASNKLLEPDLRPRLLALSVQP